jgi:hypothetical protein
MVPMNRRGFTEAVLTAALVPLLGPGTPLAPAWWGPTPGLPVPPGDELDAMARAMAEAVRARYGSRLDEAGLSAVTRQIRNTLERGQQMRQTELANGDEPDFVFSAPGDAAT